MFKRKLLILVCLVASLAGCKKTAVGVHPGSISNLDSYAYDILIVEQDVINQAKAQFTAGQLPEASKQPLNYAIQQYNIALAAWQAYHASGANASVLQQSIDTLVAAVGQLQKSLNKQPVIGWIPPFNAEVVWA